MFERLTVSVDELVTRPGCFLALAMTGIDSTDPKLITVDSIEDGWMDG